MNYQDTEFQECASCAAKAGLCLSCLHNRAAIEILKRKLDETVEKIIKFADYVKSLG